MTVSVNIVDTAINPTVVGGPHDGEKIPSRNGLYQTMTSVGGYVFVTAYVLRDGIKESRVARIPVVGGSIAGQTADRDVLVKSGFENPDQGHFGASVATDGTRLFTHPNEHVGPLALMESPDLDPANLAAIDPTVFGSPTTTSYVKLLRNPHTDDVFMWYRHIANSQAMWVRRASTGTWSEFKSGANERMLRFSGGEWPYSINSSMDFAAGGKIAHTWSTFPTAEPRRMTHSYLIESDDNGTTWRHPDGTAIPLHIGAWAPKALDFTIAGGSVGAVGYGSNGEPIVANTCPHLDGTRGLWVSRWKDGAFEATLLEEFGAEINGGVQMIREPGGIGLLTVNADAVMHLWVTRDDGDSWWRYVLLDTSANPSGQALPDPSAFGVHGVHRAQLQRPTDRSPAPTDGTVDQIIEFTMPTPPSASTPLTTPAGTLTAAGGGTLTVA